MQCLQPICIKGQLMPCGKCPACLRNRQNDWVFRLNEELKIAPYSYFFTLTYRDDDLPLIGSVKYKFDFPCLCKRDIQLFMKRLRKNIKEKIKYHVVGEYGPQTLRPHYHGLLFSFVPIDETLFVSCWSKSDLKFDVFEPAFTRSAAGYVSKYICAVPFLPDFIKESDKCIKPFTLCSNGLGLSYLETNPELVKKKLDQDETFVVLDGIKMPMPRYYIDKLYPKPDILVRNQRTRVLEAKAKAIFDVKRRKYLLYCKKYNLKPDSDESLQRYDDYLLMVRKDLWRRSYKNSKYNLSKMKL